MTALRTLVSLVMLAFAASALAQTASEGAIKGGSILPGESGGMPEGTAKAPSTEGLKRCYELSGTLREQCLLQEQGASTGGTSDTTEKPAGPTVRDPLTAPPPQNPR